MSTRVRRRQDRKGRPWVVVYTDHTGAARYESRDKHGVPFGTTPAGRERAEVRAAEIRRDLGQAAPMPTHDPNITVQAFGEWWLEKLEPGVEEKTGHKRNTLISYRKQCEKHIFPTLGTRRMRDVHQQQVVKMLEDKKAEGLKESSVHTTYRVLRILFERAWFEGVITSQPIRGLWSKMTTFTRRRQKDKAVDRANVMSRAEVDRLLATAEGQERVMLETKYRAGLRMGELVALQLEDVDLARRRLRVQASLMDKRDGLTLEDRLDSPKSGAERYVQISGRLAPILEAQLARRQKETLAGLRSPWLFLRNGAPVNGAHLRARFALIAKKAGLSPHLTPHSLRHSWATHMLESGASIIKLAEQLGHSSPKITLEHYAWAIPSEDEGFADRLDSPATTTHNHFQAPVAVGQRETNNLGGKEAPENTEIGLPMVITGYRPGTISRESESSESKNRKNPKKHSGGRE